MTEKLPCVYILANKKNGTIYTGATSDLLRRVSEHKRGEMEGFTKRYGLKKLVYFETHPTMTSAIEREKQIKTGSRKKKLFLIEKENPDWKDLFDEL